ncbi:HupE/UreJ family protein [Hoeflea sp. WL0058]|uniref:HupE/UreJ family protein n=1 Tax=Flavimaribacter sediminis TaxID=2865987 RepID=A0AAE3D3J3_9HYPH|nr:HupE/UreJ family protein [Flavimaribacter sediminis]MBW8640177.1 HupE/UreJ family protein [Flavimaribacter sediminis]
MRRLLFLTVFLGGDIVSARAHSPVPGIGEFYNGMLHPVLVPAHLVTLLALGLVIGQHAPKSSNMALPAFIVALVAALAYPTPPVSDIALLYLALVCGLVAVLAFDIGAVGPAVFALAVAVLIGNSVNADIPSEQSPWLLRAGSTLGATLILIIFGGVAALLKSRWNGIAIRVLGSWVAAVALMIIALSFAPGA